MKRCNSRKLCQFIGITKAFDIPDFSKNLHCCDDIYTGNGCKCAAKHLIHLFQHLVYLCQLAVIVL